MKPAKDKNPLKMRSTTTSMLLCEIVKKRTLSCYNASAPLSDSGGGGTEVRGAGLYRYYLAHQYRRLKNYQSAKRQSWNYRFPLFF